MFIIFFIFLNIFFCYTLNSKESNLIRIDTNYILKGRVLDYEEQQPLAGVTVKIADTDKGTYSKKNGEFQIKLSIGKHILMFSMVGRETKIIDIDLQKDVLDFEVFLKENPALKEGIIVIAEDPGMRLMRQAIEKKINDNKYIENYTYLLYTKFVASTDTLTAGRRDDDTDTTIVSIFESFSRGYFEKPDKYFNEIIQRRQSANIPPQANLVTFGTNVNAYDDYVTILSNEIYTPFHPKAVDLYDFILDKNYKNYDNNSIARILATPNSREKLFTGIIFLDTLNLVPISVELYPNSSVQLPFGAVLKYEQTFTVEEEKYVVPKHLNIVANIDADIFWIISPRIDLKIENFVKDYKFNTKFDRSIFNKRRVEVAKNVDNFDTLFWDNNLFVPLNEKENNAYLSIYKAQQNPDSAYGTTLLDEIFGPINKFLAALNKKPFTGFEDIFRFNRVQGAYLGIGIGSDIGDYNSFYWRSGYSFADKRYNYYLNLSQFIDENKQYGLSFQIYDEIRTTDYINSLRFQSQSLLALLTKNDFYDYYYSRGFQFELNLSYGQLRFLRRDVFIRPNRLNIYFKSEKHLNALKNTDFSIFNNNKPFRDNPLIREGNLNAIGLELNYYYHPLRRFEDFGFQVGAEISNPKFINSDFDYTRIYTGLILRTKTFALSKLDIGIKAGKSLGKLPTQRFFSLESSISGISAQRAFRGMNLKEFYGNEYWSLSFEHNFGEIIPGILRIPNIAEFGIEFITYANVGWSNFTDIADFVENSSFNYNSTEATADKYYYEVGLGLNKLLLFFRVDITARLSQVSSPKFFFTITTANF